MNVEEFYQLAEYLHETPPEQMKEGAYRSAISRYYYYIFLKLRDEIIQKDERIEIKELLASPQAYFAHVALRVYIFALGKKAQKDRSLLSQVGFDAIEEVTFKTAQKLRVLHKKRKFADYTTNRKETIEYLTSESELTKGDITNEMLIRYLKNWVDESKKLTDTIKDNVNNIIFLLEKLKEKDKLPDPKKDIIKKIRPKQAG